METLDQLAEQLRLNPENQEEILQRYIDQKALTSDNLECLRMIYAQLERAHRIYMGVNSNLRHEKALVPNLIASGNVLAQTVVSFSKLIGKLEEVELGKSLSG